MILTDSGHYLVPIKDPNYQMTKQDEQLQQQATKQFFEMHSYADQMQCQDNYIKNKGTLFYTAQQIPKVGSELSFDKQLGDDFQLKTTCHNITSNNNIQDKPPDVD